MYNTAMPDPVNIEITLRARAAGGNAMPAAVGEAGDTITGYAAEMHVSIPERDAADTIAADVWINFSALEQHALNPLAYGLALGKMLFADPAFQRGLITAIQAAESADAGSSPGRMTTDLRLRLRVDSSAKELHALHWEKLCDPSTGSPLTTSERVLFSRALPGRPLALRPGPKDGLRVLAVSADPAGLEEGGWGAVDVEGELERARRGLNGIALDTLPLTWAADEQGWVDDPHGRRASFDDLADLLRGGPQSDPDFSGYDALYIATHGRLTGAGPQIALEDERGELAWVSGAELAELLGNLPMPPRLVVLAACDSAVNNSQSEDGLALDPLMAAGPLLVAEGIPAVIAMQGKVPMSTVEQFTQVFFRELARDGVIDRAMAAARLKLKKRAWWGVPVLFLRLLTGRLWSAPEAEDPAPVTRALVPHQIPPPSETFIGRAEELASLRAAIEDEECAVIGISGMGGMGKTSIALKLVDQIAGRYPDGQVYFDLGETGLRPAGATQAMAHVIHSFQPQAQQPESLSQLQAMMRSMLYDKRVLVLIDNARAEEQVRAMVPLPRGCLLIVTSWRRLDLDGLFDLALGELSDGDASAMLLDLAPDVKELALPLAQAVGKLPQAIQVLAGLLRRRPDLTPRDLLRRMREDPDRLEFSGMESLMEVSYNMLNERLKRPWKQLAVFAGDFDARAAAWMWGYVTNDMAELMVEPAVDIARDLLGALLEHSLLHFDKTARRYSMYQMAKIYATRKSEPDERLEALRAHASYYLRVLMRANALFVEGGDKVLDGLALFDRERREITAGQAWTAAASPAAAADSERDRDRLRLCSLYAGFGGYCLALRFTPREQIVWLEAGLKAAQALGDRRMEGIHHGNLGNAVQEVQGPKQAIPHFKQQLRMAREAKDYASQINAYNSLGIAYWKQGRPKPAIGEYQKAVRLARRRKDRAGEARALGNLGLAYRDLGQMQEAILHYEGQLNIAREIGDLQQESIARNNLGVEYTTLGQLDQAFETFHAALEIYKKLDDRAGYGRTLDSLGSAFRKRGDLEQARAYFEEALRYQREAFDRQGEALTCWNLGELLEQQGEVDEAIQLMQQSVDYETEIGHADAAARAKRLAAVRKKWKK